MEELSQAISRLQKPTRSAVQDAAQSAVSFASSGSAAARSVAAMMVAKFAESSAPRSALLGIFDAVLSEKNEAAEALKEHLRATIPSIASFDMPPAVVKQVHALLKKWRMNQSTQTPTSTAAGSTEQKTEQPSVTAASPAVPLKSAEARRCSQLLLSISEGLKHLPVARRVHFCEVMLSKINLSFDQVCKAAILLGALAEDVRRDAEKFRGVLPQSYMKDEATKNVSAHAISSGVGRLVELTGTAQGQQMSSKDADGTALTGVMRLHPIRQQHCLAWDVYSAKSLAVRPGNEFPKSANIVTSGHPRSRPERRNPFTYPLPQTAAVQVHQAECQVVRLNWKPTPQEWARTKDFANAPAVVLATASATSGLTMPHELQGVEALMMPESARKRRRDDTYYP